MAWKIFDFLSRKLSPKDYATIGIAPSEQAQVLGLALHIAISYIANTISKCEIKTYEGGEEKKGMLYYLLNVNPNPNQSSSQMMNQLIERLLYEGEALLVPFGPSIYVADAFGQTEYPTKANVFEGVSIEGQSVARRFPAGDVFYFKLDDRSVTDIVSAMYPSYGKSIGAAVDAFLAGNAERYKLELANIAAGDENFQKQYQNVIAKNLQDFVSSQKAVYPEFQGTKLERMESGPSTGSGDIIALRKEIFETVAQAYKIPMSMMYGNITNMSEIVKVYLSICIDPIAQMMSEELTRKTTDFESWQRGDRVVVDTSKILHVDLLDIADEVEKLVGSGAFTINQVLDRCGYDRIQDEFADAHYLTKNIAPVDETATPLEGGETIGNQNTNQGTNEVAESA